MAPDKLPVIKVLTGACVVPWWNRWALARALAWPAALFVVISIVWHYVPEDADAVATPAFGVILGLILIYCTVRCHRVVLLGDAAGGGWSWRETRFLGWLFAVYLVTSLVFALAAAFMLNLTGLQPGQNEALGLAAVLLAAIPAMYVFARMCLVFPAVALDERPGLRWLWERTAGNGLRLVVVVCVPPWILSALIGLLFRGSGATLLEGILISGLSLLALPVEVAALSLAYWELVRRAGPGPDPPV